MRLVMCLIASLVLSAALPCLSGAGASPMSAVTDLNARIHFVGTAQISADPNATKLNEIGALPETSRLRELFLSKLATTPYRLFTNQIGNTADAHADLLRPLLDNLLQSEWYLESQGAGNPPAQFVLAIHLDARQAGVWQSNLASVLTSWTGIATRKTQVEGYDGWELQKHDVPNRIRYVRAGDWSVIGWGQDEPRLQTELLKRIKTSKRPVAVAKDYWLDATVDFAGNASTRAMIGPFKPAQLHVIIEGRKDFVRPQVTVKFAEPLNITLDGWLPPTNTIHSPIISFTAARGIAPLLNAWQAENALAASSVPNQLFMWAGEQIPFQTCIAAPMPDASNYLARLQTTLVPFINSDFEAHGIKLRADWETNQSIMVKGLPLAVPYLKAMHESSGDFLLGGLFPVPPMTNSMPDAIIRELTNSGQLVYYDWEITEGRLKQWTLLNQLRFIARANQLPDTNAPGVKWLAAVQPRLGNCATEVNLTAPNELTLIRNAPIGLTAVELTFLADWLEARGFPLDNEHEFRPLPSGRGQGPDQ